MDIFNIPKSIAYFKYLLFAAILLFTACGDDNDPVTPEPEYYITYEQQFSRSTGQITTLIQFAGLGELNKYIRYDINLYSITYRTTYLDKEITCSGLVTFPETDQLMPIMSFQHGTISKNSEAPTEDLAGYGLLGSLASAGYILIIPDYIGFGSSKDLVHPYYHASSTAGSITDMLLATRELAVDLDYPFSGDVFLAGYSEGGYATMASHKKMEENPMDGFQLIASAPASGGYDLKGMQEYFFSLQTYNEPYYLAYVALSYSIVYDNPDFLSDLFNDPYAERIAALFDGSLSGNEINDNLVTTIADLIQPDILQNIDTDTKYKYIIDAFEQNSLNNWTPAINMYMYHGSDDITVPYQNSIDTYARFKELGASTEKIQFYTIEGASHGSGVLPYVTDMIEKFEDLK